MIGYNAILDIYTGLNSQGVSVTTFNSEKMTITFKNSTSCEILAISNTLKATGYNNEIILCDALLFKIRFI